jgi:predicted flap endonuclease-1-like 5' DNA nuclease
VSKDPIEDIGGIGASYARTLAERGIETTADLRARGGAAKKAVNRS